MPPLISLLLPTRGRVEYVQRLFQSIINTTHHLDQIEVVLYVDDDDIESHAISNDQIPLKKIIGPRYSMGMYNTICMEHAIGDILVLINDDMVIRTKHWDDKIIATNKLFPDQIYLAYCNDLFKKAWCTFPILSRKTCNLLVEPYPALYQGAFIDTHLFDLFKRLEHAGYPRILYLNHVVFEHLHYRTGKAAYDDTYKKRDRFGDDAAFITLTKQRKLGAQRLLAVLQNQPLPTLIPCRHVESMPKNIYKNFLLITRIFLLDNELPHSWRRFLCYWFFGRYIAMRGLLWPLVRRERSS